MSAQLRERARELWHGPRPGTPPVVRRASTYAVAVASACWAMAAVVCGLMALVGPGTEGPWDIVLGAAVAVGPLAYRAWDDPDRTLLRDIGTVPAETQPAGPAWRTALGLLAAFAVFGTAGMLLFESFTETVASGLVVASIFAVAQTTRAIQLWTWERRHPGTELVYLVDSAGSRIAARPRGGGHRELEMVFGR